MLTLRERRDYEALQEIEGAGLIDRNADVGTLFSLPLSEVKREHLVRGSGRILLVPLAHPPSPQVGGLKRQELLVVLKS